MKKPILSILLPTYNAESDLLRFFDWFSRQKISKSDFEILVLDGGSTDKTAMVAHQNNAVVIRNPHKLTEPAVALGFRRAKGELVMVIAADNIFPDPLALKKIIAVFQDKSIVAAFPKHETGPGDTIYSRYVNTFTDPFTHFVYQNTANARTFSQIYNTLIHTDVYDVYDFLGSNMRPILALAQGFTVRKNSLPRREENTDDVLSVYQLIESGGHIAYLHSVVLWHYTIKSTRQFYDKLCRAVDNAFVRKDSGITKRNTYLDAWQRARMYLYFPYAFTIILPLLQSFIGFVKDREVAWLAHWYMVMFSAPILAWRSIMNYFRVK